MVSPPNGVKPVTRIFMSVGFLFCNYFYLYYKSNRPGLQTAAKGPLQDSVCICLHPCILCAILYTGFYEKTRKLT